MYLKIENYLVYDLRESIMASKYPMSTNIKSLNDEITPTVKKLGTSEKGSGHDQFLTGIRVAFDLTFSNKAWIELERYRFLEFVSSQSTMHKIANFNLSEQYNKYVDKRIVDIMEELTDKYNQTKEVEDYLKLLYSNPCGFELTARITTNYRALKTVYSQRKNHRLPEWRDFCNWILTLPKFKELCLGEGE
jgi:DNA-binding transcriptional regulator GbsR (MarR family)